MQLHTDRDGLLHNVALQTNNGSATQTLGNFGAAAAIGQDVSNNGDMASRSPF